MKNIIIIFILLFFACLQFGCNSLPKGKHCFSVGGDYKGADGSFEYCFSPEASKKAGVPVVKGENTVNYVLPKKDVETLNKMVGGQIKAKMASVAAKKPAILELKEKIRNFRKNNR